MALGFDTLDLMAAKRLLEGLSNAGPALRIG
jgi:hypothetical protein